MYAFRPSTDMVNARVKACQGEVTGRLGVGTWRMSNSRSCSAPGPSPIVRSLRRLKITAAPLLMRGGFSQPTVAGGHGDGGSRGHVVYPRVEDDLPYVGFRVAMSQRFRSSVNIRRAWRILIRPDISTTTNHL